MSLRALFLVVFLAVAPSLAGASTGINWFGAADVTSDPAFDIGATFRGMADVNGDGLADFCRFTQTRLVCATSNGQKFGNAEVMSAQNYDAGDDTFRGLADVDGDGKADYCRFTGSGAQRRLSCGKSNGTTFGGNDVDSPAGYDAGREFRGLADVDGDGKADYCRFVGAPAEIRLSCGRSNGTTFGANDVNSQPRTLIGIQGAFRAMADVNGDGKADYCRLDSNITGEFVRCALSTGTGFADTFRSFPLGVSDGTHSALADVNGDGRADFCQNMGFGERLVCSLAMSDGFEKDQVMSAEPYDLGDATFRAMADVNGDRRADFVRVTGANPRQRILSAGLAAKALVVNTIPFMWSGETGHNSEPFLAVNPIDPSRMAASAFLPNPDGENATTAPILVSLDNGMSWSLRKTIDSAGETDDITLAFGRATATGPLFGAILRLRRGADDRYDNLVTQNLETDMRRQASRRDADQPFVQAATTRSDRLYVGVNDFSNAPRTATVDVSSTGGTSFTSVRVEKRSTLENDGPSIRPAYCAASDVVYAAFYGWRKKLASHLYQGDVVVVRDDGGAVGSNPFGALVGADGLAGTFVAQGVMIPFNATRAQLGPERIGSNLSIAVDPRNCANVYVAWCDRTGTDIYTLHVRRSRDSGLNWSTDIRTVSNATVPALAVTPGGVLGLLYQRLTADNRWETRIEQTKDNFASLSSTILSTAPANVPPPGPLPYLGDYIHLIALDGEFRGIFSANNAPAAANFPAGVLFQRAVNGNDGTLRREDDRTVRVSIDPFYFSIAAIR